jgi:hypothetical protein
MVDDRVENHSGDDDRRPGAEQGRDKGPLRPCDGKVPPRQSEYPERSHKPGRDRELARRRGKATGQAEVVESREGHADERPRRQPRADRGQDTHRIGVAGAGYHGPAQDHESHDEAKDPELHLGQNRQNGERRRGLAPILLQLSQAQQQEDGADCVGLPPDGAVEPGDRVEEDDRGSDQGAAAGTPEFPDHDPNDPRQGEVRENRQDLDALADAPAGQEADQAEEEQVDGRVVDESRSIVEPDRAVRGDVVAPVLERTQVVGEARPR